MSVESILLIKTVTFYLRMYLGIYVVEFGIANFRQLFLLAYQAEAEGGSFFLFNFRGSQKSFHLKKLRIDQKPHGIFPFKKTKDWSKAPWDADFQREPIVFPYEKLVGFYCWFWRENLSFPQYWPWLLVLLGDEQRRGIIENKH